MKTVVIAGTRSGVGKTTIAAGLLTAPVESAALRRAGGPAELRPRGVTARARCPGSKSAGGGTRAGAQRDPAGKLVVQFSYRSKFPGRGSGVAPLAAMVPVAIALVRRRRR